MLKYYIQEADILVIMFVREKVTIKLIKVSFLMIKNGRFITMAEFRIPTAIIIDFKLHVPFINLIKKNNIMRKLTKDKGKYKKKIILAVLLQ